MAELGPSRLSRTIFTRDGRQLGYADLGNPDGQPCLYFHGNFHSRLSACGALDSLAELRGVRLLSVERPGFGLSDFQPNRTLLDWPKDVVELADQLRLEKFSVLGPSGGAGYVYACAYAIPERLSAAVVKSGIVPAEIALAANVGISKWIRRADWLITHIRSQVLLKGLIELAILPRRWRARKPRVFSDDGSSDARYLWERATAESKQGWSFDPAETLRLGGRSYLQEAVIYSRPWGFELEDIAMTIHLFHGEKDSIVDVSLARKVAALLPDCRATFVPDTGHEFETVAQWDEIWKAVLGLGPEHAFHPLEV